MTPVKSLFYMAGRLAGINKFPGGEPAPSQFVDYLQQANLMIGKANTNSLMIYGMNIAAYALTAGKKIYTIGGPGLGADFDAPRPQGGIEIANLIYQPGSGHPIREPISVYNFQQWGHIKLQDIPGGLPTRLYCDGNNPISNIYLWTQDSGADKLELYTWNTLAKLHTIDDVVDLPDGYEDWFVNNLAVRLASVFHAQGAEVTQDTRDEALRSAAAIESLNAPTPLMDLPSALFQTSGLSRGGFNRYTGD